MFSHNHSTSCLSIYLLFIFIIVVCLAIFLLLYLLYAALLQLLIFFYSSFQFNQKYHTIMFYFYLFFMTNFQFVFTSNYQYDSNHIQIKNHLSQIKFIQKINELTRYFKFLFSYNYKLYNNLSMFYKILIQPAKSKKSTCKNCNSIIEAKTLRAKVVDARQFNAFINKHGRNNLQGQGLSRGYFQCVGPKGQTISIIKYFVHLKCYQPIQPHPFERQYFDLKSLNKNDNIVFNNWLKEKKQSQAQNKSKTTKKTKGNKQIKNQKENQQILKREKKSKKIKKKTSRKTK